MLSVVKVTPHTSVPCHSVLHRLLCTPIVYLYNAGTRFHRLEANWSEVVSPGRLSWAPSTVTVVVRRLRAMVRAGKAASGWRWSKTRSVRCWRKTYRKTPVSGPAMWHVTNRLRSSRNSKEQQEHVTKRPPTVCAEETSILNNYLWVISIKYKTIHNRDGVFN